MLRPGEKEGRWRPWNREVAGPGLLAAGLTLTVGACSFLLDFDEPIGDGTEDAGLVDGGFDAADLPDGNADSDAAAAANCTAFEPNDSLLEAATITPMTLEAAICPDLDGDFYSFSLLDNTNLTITLAFDNSNSDLNLQLYNSAGAVVSASVGTDATEVIERGPDLGGVALPSGDYRIEVLSVTGDVTLDYTLTLGLELASAQ